MAGRNVGTFVKDDDLANALADLRRNYILQYRGKPIPESHHSESAVERAYGFLERQYADAREKVLSQIPTDRFTDAQLFVLAALAYAWTVQYPLSLSTDSVEWNYNRKEILRVILDGSVTVDGRRSEWSHYAWKKSTTISEVQNMIRECGWMTIKRGGPGTNTRMIPGEECKLSMASPIRTSSPLLAFPAFTSITSPIPAPIPTVDASGMQWMEVSYRELFGDCIAALALSPTRAFNLALKSLGILHYHQTLGTGYWVDAGAPKEDGFQPRIEITEHWLRYPESDQPLIDRAVRETREKLSNKKLTMKELRRITDAY